MLPRPPSTSASRRATLVSQVRPKDPEAYSLFVSPTQPTPKAEIIDPVRELTPNSAPAQPKTSLFEGLVSAYGAISWIFGFKEKYSLVLLIICGGALIGFCLSRTIMMSPDNIHHLTPAGEWFWFSRPLYKACIIIHVYLSIISGFFTVFQFLPAIRRRSVALHRLNGYLVLLLLLPATICGAIVARRAFGGDPDTQSGFYVLAILIISAATMGILNVKQTRKHRKWMLRTAACLGVPITTRVISLIARRIVSDLGSYYALWRCDQLLFVVTDVNTVRQSYPQCAQAGANNVTDVFVAVHASVNGSHLTSSSAVRLTFGMSIWIAMVSHIIAVEIYIRKTESSNRHRRGFVLERDDDDILKSTPDDR